MGLLHPSGRTEGGQRLYAPDCLAILAEIKRLQNAHWKLEDIAKRYGEDRLAQPVIDEVVELERQMKELEGRLDNMRVALHAELHRGSGSATLKKEIARLVAQGMALANGLALMLAEHGELFSKG